jgi:hypothetical protein
VLRIAAPGSGLFAPVEVGDDGAAAASGRWTHFEANCVCRTHSAELVARTTVTFSLLQARASTGGGGGAAGGGLAEKSEIDLRRAAAAAPELDDGETEVIASAALVLDGTLISADSLCPKRQSAAAADAPPAGGGGDGGDGDGGEAPKPKPEEAGGVIVPLVLHRGGRFLATATVRLEVAMVTMEGAAA